MRNENFSKITMILRGYEYAAVRNVCLAVEQSEHIKNLEITMNTKQSAQIIEKISREFGERLHIGAGTIRSLNDAITAVNAGAEFLLSPSVMEQSIVEYAKQRKVKTICGAFSATEVCLALDRGCDIIKIFPVSNVCQSYFKDLRGPLGNFEIMAVGGVNKENAKRFFDMGADYLGLGGLISKTVLQENHVEKMLQDCLAFEHAVFGK